MDKYLRRCLKRLRDWGAPLKDWRCAALSDEESASFKCELCGCENVRYVHIMEHDEYFEKLYVGCVCAGIMEDNILDAKNRERKMKNRAGRKRNFIKRKWNMTRFGEHHLKYRGKDVFINEYNGQYFCRCGEETAGFYRGIPIDNFLSACYAAFELTDPIEDLMI